jgi:anthranilate phosphoribosyltransferase
MIREAIAKLVAMVDLSQQEAEGVMHEIMHGEATPSQISAFLTALRMKGETVAEITGCATAMRANALAVKTRQRELVDTCGTGGDEVGTFNISTTVAFVVASAGVAVAKHGNRSVSSRCGSADLLESLGAKIELGPEDAARCIDEVGIGFLFAPHLHPAMKHAMPSRREMGIRTIFNLLGPLTNPASATAQLLGVYDADLTEPLAQVLSLLGTHQALVVHGANGVDELSTTGANKVTQLRDGEITTYYLEPGELGLPPASLEDLQGGRPQENVEITLGMLRGDKGPKRDVVLLNAAAALVIAQKAPDLEHGLGMAAQAIDSGQALKKLEHFVQFSQSLGESRVSG